MNTKRIFPCLIFMVSILPALAVKPDPTEINERLNLKFEALNESLSGLVDQAVVENADIFTPAQRDHMLKARGRANRSRQRVHEAGGLKRLARKGKLECVVNEIFGDNIGNDDGICEKGEMCEEIVGDGIGDEDGKCEWKFCGKKELCVENCDEDAVDEVGDNYDMEAADDIEGSIDDVTNILDDASFMLEVRSQQMAVMAAIKQAVDPNDKCALLPVARQRSHTYGELQAMLAAANVATMAYNSCDSGCNQDAFGFNCSAVCIVLAVASGIVDTISDACELQDDTVTAEQVDAACECLNQMGDEISGLKEQLGDLSDMVEERFNEVVELLNTPQGQRPEFPVKDVKE